MASSPESTNPQPREISLNDLGLAHILSDSYDAAKWPTWEAVEGLLPGDVITDIGSEQDFNRLDTAVETWAYGKSLTPQERNITRSYSNFAGTLAQEMKPSGFYGSLRNGTAVVLPASGGRELNLLLGAELHSSGRGRVGSVTRAVYYGGPASHRKIHNFSNLKQVRGFVENLQQDAQRGAQVAGQIALARIVSAGLPTTGKRRR